MREIVSPLDGLRSPFGFIRGGGVVPFSPSTLFASGEEGAWYEPSTTTAFRSTTDLTPCDYGQSCGFLLDKSQGAGYSGGSFTGLGSELVTNGTFDSNITGWANGLTASSSWISGEIFVTGGAQFGVYQQLSGLTVGTTYYLSADGRVGTGSDVRVRITSDTDLITTRAESNVVTATGSNEQMSLTFVAQETNPAVYLRTSGNGDTGYFDNISVRELPGNHATQGTESARPILARVPETGRRNLLERTEEFDNAYWTKLRSTITANAATAPDGTTTADKIVGNDTLWGGVASGGTFASGTSRTLSVYAKSDVVNFVALASNAGSDRTWFNLSTGAVGTTAASHTAAISDAGSGWYRCSITTTTADPELIYAARADGSTTVFSGDSIYLWGAQLEEGSSATSYQKVVDQYDITEAGVTSLEYLAFDGSDDGMATASIDFTATDKMSVFAGVESDTNSGVYIFAEISAAVATNANSWNMFREDQGYGFNSRGSATPEINNVTSGYPASSPNVVTGLSDISGDSVTLRIDGIQAAQSLADQGAGNYGNYPLNIGARNNAASLWFDGKLFSLIVRGAASTAQEISDTESYVANLSGVTL